MPVSFGVNVMPTTSPKRRLFSRSVRYCRKMVYEPETENEMTTDSYAWLDGPICWPFATPAPAGVSAFVSMETSRTRMPYFEADAVQVEREAHVIDAIRYELVEPVDISLRERIVPGEELVAHVLELLALVSAWSYWDSCATRAWTVRYVGLIYQKKMPPAITRNRMGRKSLMVSRAAWPPVRGSGRALGGSR